MSDPEPDIDLEKICLDVPEIPDYPDWKRGLKYGIIAGFFLSPIGLLVPATDKAALLPDKIFFVAVFFVSMFLIFGAVGAFRPQLRR